MNPPFTSITLDPAFFVGLIVLFLGERLLANREVTKFQKLTWLEIRETLLTPMVLIVSSNKVIGVATDAFGRTVRAVTVENGRFEQKLFTSTEQACFSISPFGIFFCIKLFHKNRIIMGELVLHFFCHVVHDRTFGIVEHCIVEGQMDVFLEFFKRVVAIVFKSLPDGSKIHRFLDNFKVIR